MIEDIQFTAAQRALIEATTSLYVEACPGAGKTQAIVQRYIERPVQHPRKGVALISFTNAAADEAHRRAADRPELLRVPNFIGTIDSFINRFLVAPCMLAKQGISPTFRDTWASVPRTTIDTGGRLKPSLDAFIIGDDAAVLDVDRLPWSERQTGRDLEFWQRESLERQAMIRWNELVAAGILAASASRTMLRRYLTDAHLKGILTELLAARFSEAIVDEIQDCCEEDLLVMELLRDAGVALVVVGDPDQAIYGVRTESPAHLPQFLATLPSGDRLNGNFRSSPAICSIVDSLRESAESDAPVGLHSGVATPVLLLRHRRPAELPVMLSKFASDRAIPLERTIVLAHKGNTARTSAGGSSDHYKVGGSKLARLAAACYQLADKSRSAAAQSKALADVAVLLRELGDPDIPHDAYLEGIGLTEREFREECLRLAMATPNPYDGPPSTFKAVWHAAVDSQRRLGWAPRGLRNLPNDTWPEKPATSTTLLPYSTVHAFKGLQEECVALVIPEPSNGRPSQGVVEWTNQSAGEARRVLYVGASRAMKLLIVAAHQSLYDAVRSNLLRDNVPFEET